MRVKYKTYEKYKDSGVPSLGKVPENWEVKKLWTLGDFSSSGIDKKINPRESLVKMVNYTDIYGNKNNTIDRSLDLMEVSCPKDKIISKSVLKGDLIFTPSSETKDEIGLSALIIEDLENTVYSYHVVRFRSESIEFYFKKYICNNDFVLQQFSRRCNGTTRKVLSKDDFRQVKVVIPPIAEQRKIAEFLDQKTAEIDAAIKNKERLVELLKEQKDIIINDAVTKGLNPKVKMKESGINWIGKIPEHWEVLPGRVCLKSKQVSNKGLKVKTVLSLSYGSIVIKPEEKLHGLVPESFETYQIVCPGDIIVRVMDLQNDHTSLRIGLVKDHGIITSAYVCLEMGEKMESYYSYLYLHNLDILKVFYGMGSGLRQNLSYVDFKYLQVLVPPKNEQKEIISFVKEIETKTEELTRSTKNEIEKLKEFRKTLISHAVTGKIKI